MDSLRERDLSIQVHQTDDVIVLDWHGKSVDRQPQRILEPFFARLLDTASEKALRIEMRFEHLLHFNSSTIGCLIQAFQDAGSRDLKLLVTYDEKLAWQRLSFDALRVFSKNNPLLELKAVSAHAIA